jgi:hypothetical protein
MTERYCDCEDAKPIDSSPYTKFAKTDCKSYIQPPKRYSLDVGPYYGECSNRNKFMAVRERFSIYNHEVCWTLNVKKVPEWSECIGCTHYEHQNKVIKWIKLIRWTMYATGISRPWVWWQCR